jgi:toxin ParE1/3/4
MTCFRFTKAADHDFAEIFDFGIDVFGKEQALRYQEGLVQRLQAITEAPLHYPIADHVAPHYRRSVYGSHSIYYRIENDYILIVRILGQQDTTSAF